ncbi:unnamed protein product [Amoebophrya sp. A120]|nr:unnamed protein product [Amoebophrya sp. A120]|eukprot:GSA120T00012090001.1
MDPSYSRVSADDLLRIVDQADARAGAVSPARQPSAASSSTGRPGPHDPQQHQLPPSSSTGAAASSSSAPPPDTDWDLIVGSLLKPANGTSAETSCSANPPQMSPLDAEQIREILRADFEELAGANSASTSTSAHDKLNNAGSSTSSQPPNRIDQQSFQSEDFSQQTSEFLQQNFELYEDAFDLFGAVTVEKAVKLGQCDTLEEISDYVERHQHEPDWALSMEAIDFRQTLDLLTKVHDIYAAKTTTESESFGAAMELTPKAGVDESVDEDEQRNRRLELLHKIFSKIAYHPFDDKVRSVKAKVIYDKMSADLLLQGKVADLMVTCGFQIKAESPRGNNDANNTTSIAAQVMRVKQEKLNLTVQNANSQVVFHFPHQLDTDRKEVVRFHRVFSLLEDLVSSLQVEELQAVEVDLAPGGATSATEVLCSTPNLSSSAQSSKNTVVASTPSILELQPPVILTPKVVQQGTTSKASSSSSVGSPTPNSNQSFSPPERGVHPGGETTSRSKPPQQQNRPGSGKKEPYIPGKKPPISKDEMRLKRLAKLEEGTSAGSSLGSTAAKAKSSAARSLQGALDYGTMRRKVVKEQDRREKEQEQRTGVVRRRNKPKATGYWGNVWSLMEHNNTAENFQIRSVPNRNNPVWRSEDDPIKRGNDGFSTGGRGTPSLSELTDRKAKFFNLQDVENLRWRDAIRDTPKYAESWWNSQPQSTNYSEVARRSYDPAYLGRKALDYTNRFRGENGLPPLKWNEAMAQIAKKHAEQMAKGEMPFSHDGFNERVRQFPFHSYSSAENLAYNQGHADTAGVAVNGWIHSPGHCKNLLSLTNLCGIGVAGRADGTFYFTQLFAKTAGGLAP